MSDRYSLSLAMVLDESKHMQAQGIADEKQHASAMLSILNWGKDEASIRGFRESTAQYRGMTSVEDSLRRLLPMLRDSGKAMLFDAVYASILDVAANGSKEKKAVLVLSNGRDDGSIQSLNSCIARARAAGIHVFTVGLGPDIRDSSLRVLADSTQAWYFSGTNSGTMVGIYDALTTWLTSDGRCWIIYETACMDGENRTVDLVVRDTCGGSARASGSYRTPMDLSIPLLTTRMERAATWERQRVNIPIHIDASELGDTIQPFRCSVLFMDALLHLDTVVALKGSLLEAVPFVFTRIPGGVELRTTAPVPVTGHALPAKLADLRFTVLQASLRDTFHCPLVFSSWIFDTGCYRTARTNGEVVILPSGPTSVSAPSGADARMDIYPEPNAGSFTVRLRLDAPQAITMRVRNVLGQIVHESSRFATEGEQTFEIQLGEVPKGVYLLETNIGAKHLVKSITVLK
ncbi:MAG: VWA domain-containing protein [Ignavibacteria bacterium]|nr:VWA domain-containing protein [Ignavibacteria bacterium]